MTSSKRDQGDPLQGYLRRERHGPCRHDSAAISDESTQSQSSTTTREDHVQSLCLEVCGDNAVGTNSGYGEGSYPYTALPEGCIRLLQLTPLDSTLGVSCELKTYQMHQGCPTYKALSYTWGKGPEDSKILIDGHTVTIRKNLWRFLREASKMSALQNGLFWIDALCINQRDDQERAQQVQLMRHIYPTAVSVVSWLGPAYDGGDKALAFIKGLHKKYRADRRLLRRGKDTAISMAALCLRPYWTRLWVVQEISLARKIELMCEGNLAPWECFRDLLLALNKPDDSPAEGQVATGLKHVDIHYEVIARSPAMTIVSEIQQLDTSNLHDLIIATGHLQCTDIRDRVYALLGIVQEGHANLVPDYSVPLPALLNDVLRNYHQIRPPHDLSEVHRQCRALERIFALEEWAMTTATPLPADSTSSPLHQDLARMLESPLHTGIWWTLYYGQHRVEQLYLAERNVVHACFDQAALRGSPAAARVALNHPIISQLVRMSQDEYITLYGKIARWRTSTHPKLNSALAAVAHWGHVEIFAMLFELSAASGSVHDWNSITHCLCRDGHYELLKLLLAFDGTINLTACKGLFAAARSGHLEIVKLLIDQGVQVDKHYNDPLPCQTLPGAQPHERHRRIARLEAYGLDRKLRGRASCNVLVAAAQGGCLEVVEYLLAKHTGIDVEDCSAAWTPLVAAAAYGRLEIAKLLLAQGADPNFESQRIDEPFSAVHEASISGWPEMIKLLMANGARVEPEVVALYIELAEAIDTNEASTTRSVIQRLVSTSDFFASLQARHRIAESGISHRSELETTDWDWTDLVYEPSSP